MVLNSIAKLYKTPVQHRWIVKILGSRQPFSFNAPAQKNQPSDIARLKSSSRGGQNLSERYKRLERSLRGKQHLEEDISALSQNSAGNASSKRKAADYTTFRGFKIPEKPKSPADDECCMSGCAICVYDLYEESLAAYNDSVNALRASLSSTNIPEEEWPDSIRTKQGRDHGETRKSVALSAFEEMERALKAKKDAETQHNVQLNAGTSAANTGDQHFLRSSSTLVTYSTQKYKSSLYSAYEGIRWILFSNR